MNRNSVNRITLQSVTNANKKRACTLVRSCLDDKVIDPFRNYFQLIEHSIRKLFSTKAANNEINRTHKRALRILFKDYDSSFDELLEKSESVKIHVQNLQKLMIEIYKTMNNLNPSYIWEFHEEKVVKYDLRTKNLCRLPKTQTTKFGIESLSFRGSLLWNTLRDQIKALPNVAAFKRAIKHWLGDKCNCRICK